MAHDSFDDHSKRHLFQQLEHPNDHQHDDEVGVGGGRLMGLADCKGLPAACPPDRVDALLCADAAIHFLHFLDAHCQNRMLPPCHSLWAECFAS